eukprot:jgi/Mesvir1/5435/Mv15494-RA.1
MTTDYFEPAEVEDILESLHSEFPDSPSTLWDHPDWLMEAIDMPDLAFTPDDGIGSGPFLSDDFTGSPSATTTATTTCSGDECLSSGSHPWGKFSDAVASLHPRESTANCEGEDDTESESTLQPGPKRRRTTKVGKSGRSQPTTFARVPDARPGTAARATCRSAGVPCTDTMAGIHVGMATDLSGSHAQGQGQAGPMSAPVASSLPPSQLAQGPRFMPVPQFPQQGVAPDASKRGGYGSQVLLPHGAPAPAPTLPHLLPAPTMILGQAKYPLPPCRPRHRAVPVHQLGYTTPVMMQPRDMRIAIGLPYVASGHLSARSVGPLPLGLRPPILEDVDAELQRRGLTHLLISSGF